MIDDDYDEINDAVYVSPKELAEMQEQLNLARSRAMHHIAEKTKSVDSKTQILQRVLESANKNRSN